MHYKFQVGSNIWKIHVDQITNIGSKVPLSNYTNFEERDTGNCRSRNTDIKQGDS